MTKKEFLTIPNMLTLSRLVGLPFLLTCFFFEEFWVRFVAVGLFVVLSFTDFLDGFFARRLDKESVIGAMIDPIIDKIFVSVMFVGLLAFQYIHPIHGMAIALMITRELCVSGMREITAKASDTERTLPVLYIAKWKTAMQIAAIAILLWDGTLGPDIHNLGLLALWTATLLSMISGGMYIYQAMFILPSDMATGTKTKKK